jgi:peptidoglycan/xylan/chitin deacetylase (PgdA/CDA1 family)
MDAGVAFLMYHELELPGRELCQSDPGYTRYIVPASAFENQLRSLKNLGYQGVSVGQSLKLPAEKRVVITFDDGCETDLEAAAPVLRELDFGATFYVTAGFLGRRGFMTEAQLRELCGRGFEVGCHSMTHPYLPELDPAGLEREIVESKSGLEQIVGKPVDHFSCPGGRYDDRVVEVVKRAGYQTLATSRPQLNFRSTNRYALGRIAVLCDTTEEELARMCRGAGFWKLSLQHNLLDAAKKILGNHAYERLRATLLAGRPSE